MKGLSLHHCLHTYVTKHVCAWATASFVAPALGFHQTKVVGRVPILITQQLRVQAPQLSLQSRRIF